MNRNTRAARSALYVLAGSVALALGGCGGFDGVQLNGKIFDAMGVGGEGQKAGEPKLAQRSGLVVPPSTEALPVPGSRPDADAADVASLQDPDKLAVVSEADKQAAQDAYCKKNYEEAMQRGDGNADLATGPLGPCRGSVMGALKKWQGGGDSSSDPNDTQ